MYAIRSYYVLGNIDLVRDSLVFFTALANVKGLGGHTGGAFDIVPELLIIDGFMKGSPAIHPVITSYSIHYTKLYDFRLLVPIEHGHHILDRDPVTRLVEIDGVYRRRPLHETVDNKQLRHDIKSTRNNFV